MSTEPQRQKEQAPDLHRPEPQGADHKAPVVDAQPSEAASGQRQTQNQSQSQSQANSDQSQPENNSAFVPDYEPQEMPQTQRNLQPTQGIDADIDTQDG